MVSYENMSSVSHKVEPREGLGSCLRLWIYLLLTPEQEKAAFGPKAHPRQRHRAAVGPQPPARLNGVSALHSLMLQTQTPAILLEMTLLLLWIAQ